MLVGKRGTAERDHLVDCVGLACVAAQEEGQGTPERRAGTIARSLGTVGRGVRRLRLRTEIDGAHECGLELEREVEPVWPDELGRPREQRCSGRVAAVDRTVAGGGEPGGGTVGQLRVGLPKLGVAPDCLFEVVADDLVALDQRSGVLLEPAGEPGVQVGTGMTLRPLPWSRALSYACRRCADLSISRLQRSVRYATGSIRW